MIFIIHHDIRADAWMRCDSLTASTPAEWGTVVPRAFSFSGDTVILRVLDGNRRLKWLKMQ